jgi:hypothetical protein
MATVQNFEALFDKFNVNTICTYVISVISPPIIIKVKVKLSLCFNWASRHEGVLEEWRYSATLSLTALDGGEWSASCPGRFTPRERAPVTHWIGGWVHPRAVLDAVVKRKVPSSRRESNPRIPIVQPVAQRYVNFEKCGSGCNPFKMVSEGLEKVIKHISRKNILSSVENRTINLPNTKQKCQPFSRDVCLWELGLAYGRSPKLGMDRLMRNENICPGRDMNPRPQLSFGLRPCEA